VERIRGESSLEYGRRGHIRGEGRRGRGKGIGQKER